MSVSFRQVGLLLIFLLGLISKYQITWAQDRIVGGQPARIEDFPYMLRLLIGTTAGKGVFACGASIIGDEWALTAAHCFERNDTDFDNITVVAGTANMRTLAPTATKHKVIEVIRNELYNGINSNQKITGDIAVMKIDPPFSFNKATQPVKLPEKGQKLETKFVTVSGWGSTWTKGKNVDVLRSVKLPEVNIENCKRKYKLIGHQVKDGEFCHGFNFLLLITRDKCFGDSGGPLVNSDGIQLGLVSYGVLCGSLGLPGVDTDVLFFRDWIKEKTGI